jgi:hypothetical protein
MATPHKHAEVIIAYANGARIESRNTGGEWGEVSNPGFYQYLEYRIKPEPKPDVRRWANVLGGELIHYSDMFSHTHNLKLTFDGETGKLKSAEVIS